MFLSFSEYQDGAADGAEEGDPPEPCKKQPRLDTECGEYPDGTPGRGADNLLLPPWPVDPRVREPLPRGKRDLSWGTAPRF